MNLGKTERLIIYSLGQFYQKLNQELQETPLQVRTSKITFIEMLNDSNLISKQERTLYKNIESLESKKLITYDGKKIKFTPEGLAILEQINQEAQQLNSLKDYFQQAKPKRKLQSVIRE
jgi:hypothetical protein